jgi:hypothetical protein
LVVDKKDYHMTSDETSCLDGEMAEKGESVNREIAVFEKYFRRFFRGEDRSNLQSALFNVPGRLVAGCWADYDNMGAVFEQLLATVPAEQIGCRMKKTAARPGIFQITCLLVSYLIARQHEILLRQVEGLPYSDEKHLEEMYLLFEAGRTILSVARSDGAHFPGEAQDSMPLLDDAAQQTLVRQLCEPSPQDLSWRRRAWAALTAYNFLFHGEMRDGIFNHGPYDLGGGRCLLVKELTELHNDYFPWSTKIRELPAGFVRAMILKDVECRFDVLGGVATQPRVFDDRIVLDGLFEISKGQLIPSDESTAMEILDVVSENSRVLYEEFCSWEETRKLRYGTLLHANFLRGFWEMIPGHGAHELARRTIAGYERSGEAHFSELAARRTPLVMEHIAGTAGPIFSPLRL